MKRLDNIFKQYLKDEFDSCCNSISEVKRDLIEEKKLLRAYEKYEQFMNVGRLNAKEGKLKKRILLLRDRLSLRGVNLSEEYNFTYFFKIDEYGD